MRFNFDADVVKRVLLRSLGNQFELGAGLLIEQIYLIQVICSQSTVIFLLFASSQFFAFIFCRRIGYVKSLRRYRFAVLFIVFREILGATIFSLIWFFNLTMQRHRLVKISRILLVIVEDSRPNRRTRACIIWLYFFIIISVILTMLVQFNG